MVAGLDVPRDCGVSEPRWVSIVSVSRNSLGHKARSQFSVSNFGIRVEKTGIDNGIFARDTGDEVIIDLQNFSTTFSHIAKQKLNAMADTTEIYLRHPS